MRIALVFSLLTILAMVAQKAPADNLNDVRCVPYEMPHTSTVPVNGFQCFDIRSGSPMDQAGIKNGDVIKSVDGQELNSAEQMFQLLSKVESKNYSEILILRDHRELVLQAAAEQVR